MTCWMAEQIAKNGKIIAIENDINQLNAAKRNAEKRSIQNIEFKLCSAYEIESLKTMFDFVYCRFVLHHLNNPDDVIAKIYRILNTNGIYASEEGIVNYSFSYPFSAAWGDEGLRIPPVWQDVPANQRDPNIGVKMFTKMNFAGFKNKYAKIIHPLLTTKNEKELLMLGMDETKRYYIENGHTEKEYQLLVKNTQKMIESDAQMVGFYASCQVAGVKSG